jgi:hypothetical protein
MIINGTDRDLRACYVKNGEWDVVDFACAKSGRVSILHNLSDMRRKPSAGFGLCVDRVPVAYHQGICGGTALSSALHGLVCAPPIVCDSRHNP